MKNFKKHLLANLMLILVLVCVAIHLTVVTLNLFRVINFTFQDDFNYIIAYTFVVISLLIYLLCFLMTAKLGFDFPDWIKILFYIAFFVFTNTYYILGWFDSLIAIIFLFIYISFCMAIVSISFFYNAQKDNKNRLKSTKTFILTSLFMYSTSLNSIFLGLFNFVKYLFFSSSETTSIFAILIEFATLIVVSIIIVIVLAISLNRRKKLINACLIKYNKPKSKKKTKLMLDENGDLKELNENDYIETVKNSKKKEKRPKKEKKSKQDILKLVKIDEDKSDDNN